MKYTNAADILPRELVEEIAKYVDGGLLYIPKQDGFCSWGEKSGSQSYFAERNKKIKLLYQQGKALEVLSKEFGLSYETIRKIVRK